MTLFAFADFVPGGLSAGLRLPFALRGPRFRLSGLSAKALRKHHAEHFVRGSCRIHSPVSYPGEHFLHSPEPAA